MKVNLSGVPETLFITLRVQAAETAKPNSSTRPLIPLKFDRHLSK